MVKEVVVQPNHDDQPFRPDARLKLAFSALMVLTFMVAMNSTALAVAIPVSFKVPSPASYILDYPDIFI